MPYQTSSHTHHASSAHSTDYLANAKEFIKDRLYFTWLSHHPNQYNDTVFFTVDHVLVYINFYSDFGPSNIAHVIRFCDMMNEKMTKNKNKKICLYSSHDSDKRANAAFLICAYMLLVHRQSPDDAFRPLLHVQPPFLPYRDAGYGAATYHITIPDCLRGLHKALTLGLLDIDAVDVDEYEFYEKVENGDMNWITTKFIALASPKDDAEVKKRLGSLPTSQSTAHTSAQTATVLRGGWSGGFAGLLSRNVVNPGSSGSAKPPPTSSLPTPPKYLPAYRMDDLVKLLTSRKVTTIVRLNNRTYDPKKLVDAGIEHVEMYFPDGSTPPDGILMRFLELCETRAGVIAVHCKAGLGRTGTLIAAYLMKHYKFTAAEVISFLRILRPGSVVGPQQNYLQGMQTKLHTLQPARTLPTNISLLRPATYPNHKRWPMPETPAIVAPPTTEVFSSDNDELAFEADLQHRERDKVKKISDIPIPVQPRKEDRAAENIKEWAIKTQSSLTTHLTRQPTGYTTGVHPVGSKQAIRPSSHEDMLKNANPNKDLVLTGRSRTGNSFPS
ncbi:dual specificity protein phosphatase [Gaertneriomyces semiglobifer]|nr:dual specificity protein phosphatase [Gaertneriomyces semiglobifer]